MGLYRNSHINQQDTQKFCFMRPSTASADVRQVNVNFTGIEKTLFSRISSSTVPEQKSISFAVKTPSG